MILYQTETNAFLVNNWRQIYTLFIINATPNWGINVKKYKKSRCQAITSAYKYKK